MRRRTFLSLAAFASLPVLAQQAEKLPSGDAVVDRFIEVTGGRQAYEKLTSEVSTGRMEMPAQGIKANVKAMRSKAGSRTLIEIEGVGKMEEGSNGGVAWEKSVMTGARIKNGAEQAIAFRTAAMDREHNWRSYYTGAENQGIENVNGEDCYKILLAAKVGKPETRFYAKESGLLLKMVLTIPHPMGEIPAETVMSDYREAGGIKTPYRTEMSVMGQKMNMAFDNVQHNAEVTAADLALPAEVASLAAKSVDKKPPEK